MWSIRRQNAMIRAMAEPTPAGQLAVLAWLDEVDAHVRSGNRKELPRLEARGTLDLAGVRRAAEVAETVLEAGGLGMSDALETMLAQVVMRPDEEFVPFWERMMVPRHKFGRRDTTASARAQLGGLALSELAAAGSVLARDAMLRALPSLGATDRGDLVVRACLHGHADDDLPPGQSGTWFDAIRRMALEDTDFEARYLARCALRLVGEETNGDAASAIYALELRVEPFSCVIEVPASSTPADLHASIQGALRWTADQSWCFHLSGESRDWRFAWPNEHWLARWLPPDFHFDDEDGEDAEDGQDEAAAVDEESAREPLDPQPARLGDLGLRVGNKLLYRVGVFAERLVSLKVRRIDAAPRTRAPLPAIKERKGRPPKQYPR
jgi:hypothetical protein